MYYKMLSLHLRRGAVRGTLSPSLSLPPFRPLSLSSELPSNPGGQGACSSAHVFGFRVECNSWRPGVFLSSALTTAVVVVVVAAQRCPGQRSSARTSIASNPCTLKQGELLDCQSPGLQRWTSERGCVLCGAALPTQWTSRVSLHQFVYGCVTKYIPHTAIKSIEWRQVDF